MSLPRRVPPKRRSTKKAAQLAAAGQGSRSGYSTITTPRKPVRKVNVKRRQSEFARCFHSKARVQFVKQLRCAGCGNGGPCDNHHIRNDGAGRKADYTQIIPLCRDCHWEWHDLGRATFQSNHVMNAAELAAWTEQEWQSHVTNTHADKMREIL